MISGPFGVYPGAARCLSINKYDTSAGLRGKGADCVLAVKWKSVNGSMVTDAVSICCRAGPVLVLGSVCELQLSQKGNVSLLTVFLISRGQRQDGSRGHSRAPGPEPTSLFFFLFVFTRNERHILRYRRRW